MGPDSWGTPNSWMVFVRENPINMDDLGYPQIIYSYRMFHCTPTILGVSPWLWKPPSQTVSQVTCDNHVWSFWSHHWYSWFSSWFIILKSLCLNIWGGSLHRNFPASYRYTHQPWNIPKSWRPGDFLSTWVVVSWATPSWKRLEWVRQLGWWNSQ